MWVVNTKITKVSGSDYRGEIGLAGKAKLNCITLWVKWVCLQGCKTVKGIYTIKKSVDLHGLSIRLRGYSGNANYLNSCQSERGREVSLGTGRM